jgi:hypothetical protein
MLKKFANLRINFVITFFGAALIILMIKLTPLLLPSYYFNFSTLLGGGSEPFIVDPPGVTGKKLCELMRAQGVSEKSFNQHINCSIEFIASSSNKPLFSTEETDKIYNTIISSDAEVRAAIDQAATTVTIEQLSDDKIKDFAADDQNVSDLRDAIVQHYVDQFTPVINGGSKKVDKKLNELLKTNTGNQAEEDSTEEFQPRNLSPDTVDRVIRAHQTLKPQLTSDAFAHQVGPIKKSSVDKILKETMSRDDFASNISQSYIDNFTDGLQEKIKQAFAQFQIVGGKEHDREVIFNEIKKVSLSYYVISILVRLAPVILFGLITGALFGRDELLSISLAGALAAFLLSWPLMLMWDQLVSLTWQSKRNTFLLFYAAYIFSYLMVAYSSAIFGGWLTERAGLQPIVRRAQAPANVALSFTWHEVAASLTGTVVTNVLLYGWHLIIASSAATHS